MELMTPVYIKTDKDFEWPDDKLFYLLTSEGLMICRNHEWFRSCAPAEKGPGELESQEPFATFNYPKIPRFLMEKAVAFFRTITRTRHWESALLLVWNKDTQEVELLCPDQEASGASVKYTTPTLPPHLVIIGDAHSHCDFGATPSMTDTDDELHRAGLHIIVGNQYKNCPDFFCASVVDGERFDIDDLNEVIQDFDGMAHQYSIVHGDVAEVPEDWLKKVKEHKWTYSGSYWGGGGSTYLVNKPDKKDKKAIDRALRKFSRAEVRPTVMEVRSVLFSVTKRLSYTSCEERATEFVNQWGDHHSNATDPEKPNATSALTE